jgi:branched-chain amino acid transport system permease protein
MNRQIRLEFRLEPKRMLGFLVVAFLAMWPWFPFTPFSVLGDAILAAEYSIVAISLVLLIGWVGQISIAQAAMVGIGAYTTALIANHANIPFPASLPFAAACAGLAAGILGAVALRVRGLYLAVATLIFGYMADEFLFRQTWFSGYGGEAVIRQPIIGHAGAFPSFDFTDRRVFYYVAWACTIVALYAAANIRSAKTGRAFFAVRGSEVAAASLGIDVTRYKLLAFVLSGVMAGVAGNLIMVGQQAAGAQQFNLSQSIFFLSIAVVGGLSSLGGALTASLVFAGLNEAFLRIHALNGYLDITSALLLGVVLLAYPGGLGALPDLFRARKRQVLELVRRVQDRARVRQVIQAIERDSVATEPVAPALSVVTPSETPANGQSAPTSVEPEKAEPAVSVLDLEHLPVDIPTLRDERAKVIDAVGITVRFGGLVANNDVSFNVREREIVGLIGPNGAGKTTLFNAVAGLNQPSSGRVTLLGKDVTTWPVHERARLGVGRTFQAIQLFGQLTVFENLMVATHTQNPSGVFSHVFAADRSIRADLAARRRVLEVLELLELRSLANRPVRGLPFGTLRMIEVARATVTGAKVIMLDEPASGLDDAETDRLANLLLYLRGALDMTLLVIEHDVPFVTSVSDYMYVIDRGRLLAEGTPLEVQRNEDVVAAYLGQASAVALEPPEPAESLPAR